MRNASLKRVGLFLAVVVSIAACQIAASASTIKVIATRVANDTNTTTGVLKALNDGGATSVGFNTTPASSVVKITFNAECGVLGPPQAWVAVTIFVDGVEANPKNNTDFALCTAQSTTEFQWVGAVRQSTIKVAAGAHKVTVRIDLLNGATAWWLGDTSIAVETQP